MVDQLGRIRRRWKDGDVARFFGRVCPTLSQAGVTAYWGIDSSLGRTFAEDVRQITQCMVDVRGGRLRVLKAEGRPRHWKDLPIACSSTTPAESSCRPAPQVGAWRAVCWRCASSSA